MSSQHIPADLSSSLQTSMAKTWHGCAPMQPAGFPACCLWRAGFSHRLLLATAQGDLPRRVPARAALQRWGSSDADVQSWPMPINSRKFGAYLLLGSLGCSVLICFWYFFDVVWLFSNVCQLFSYVFNYIYIYLIVYIIIYIYCCLLPSNVYNCLYMIIYVYNCL